MKASQKLAIFAQTVGISLLVYAGPTRANPISYFDHLSYQSIEIGGISYICSGTTDPACVDISIRAIGDTSTVQAFSVPGASGFTNTLNQATLDVYFHDGHSYTASIDLTRGGLYVSVDQTNQGAGFSSAYGPTYPLAIYGGAGFASYNLVSDFLIWGWGPFSATAANNDGAPLYTTDGTEFLIKRGLAPASGFFVSTVSDVTTVPEPTGAWLVALGLVALIFSERFGKYSKNYYIKRVLLNLRRFVFFIEQRLQKI